LTSLPFRTPQRIAVPLLSTIDYAIQAAVLTMTINVFPASSSQDGVLEGNLVAASSI
jgi:hypothetical protein